MASSSSSLAPSTWLDIVQTTEQHDAFNTLLTWINTLQGNWKIDPVVWFFFSRLCLRSLILQPSFDVSDAAKVHAHLADMQCPSGSINAMNILLFHWPPKKNGQQPFGETLDPDAFSINVATQLFGDKIFDGDEFLVLDLYTRRMWITDAKNKRIQGTKVYDFDPAVSDHAGFVEAVIRCSSPKPTDGRMPLVLSFGKPVDHFWNKRFGGEQLGEINGIMRYREQFDHTEYLRYNRNIPRLENEITKLETLRDAFGLPLQSVKPYRDAMSAARVEELESYEDDDPSEGADVYGDPVIGQVTSTMLEDRSRAKAMGHSTNPLAQMSLDEVLQSLENIRMDVQDRYEKLDSEGKLEGSRSRKRTLVEWTVEMQDIIISGRSKAQPDTAKNLTDQLLLMNPRVTIWRVQDEIRRLVHEGRVAALKEQSTGTVRWTAEMLAVIKENRSKAQPESNQEITNRLRPLNSEVTLSKVSKQIQIMIENGDISSRNTTFMNRGEQSAKWTAAMDAKITAAYTKPRSKSQHWKHGLLHELQALDKNVTEYGLNGHIGRLKELGKLPKRSARRKPLKVTDEMMDYVRACRQKAPPETADAMLPQMRLLFPGIVNANQIRNLIRKLNISHDAESDKENEQPSRSTRSKSMSSISTRNQGPRFLEEMDNEYDEEL